MKRLLLAIWVVTISSLAQAGVIKGTLKEFTNNTIIVRTVSLSDYAVK